MLIDSHIHLYSHKFDADRDDVVRRAAEAGVEVMVLPAIDVASARSAINLSSRYRGVYAMAAIHPSEVTAAGEEAYAQIEALCSNPAVVAVGETGLDYYWDRSFDQAQRDSLRRHVDISRRTRLPLILHSRDRQGRTEVYEDLIEILSEAFAEDVQLEAQRPRGIFHCFGGPPWLPAAAKRLGFLLGIGGTLTFKNGQVAAMLEDVPLEQIVLETDAPYLAPEPHRGRRNEPAYIPLIAQRLAEVKEVSIEDVMAVTTANALRVFELQERYESVENRNSVRERNA